MQTASFLSIGCFEKTEPSILGCLGVGVRRGVIVRPLPLASIGFDSCLWPWNRGLAIIDALALKGGPSEAPKVVVFPSLAVCPLNLLVELEKRYILRQPFVA